VPILAILLLFGRSTVVSEGTRNIVRAMEKLGVRRFVCESSLGVGDSKWRLGLPHNLVAIPLFLRNVFADKEVQERIINESLLDWVVVRPTVLTNGPRRSVYRAGSGIGHWFFPTRISRADVADFMLKQATDPAYLRKTPGLAY
jgi:nucleoside-diphosphate-sugar epimerase